MRVHHPQSGRFSHGASTKYDAFPGGRFTRAKVPHWRIDNRSSCAARPDKFGNQRLTPQRPRNNFASRIHAGAPHIPSVQTRDVKKNASAF
jgi:hypothetical protein